MSNERRPWSTLTARVFASLTVVAVAWAFLAGWAFLTMVPGRTPQAELYRYLFGGSYEDVLPFLFAVSPLLFTIGGLIGALLTSRLRRVFRVSLAALLAFASSTVGAIAMLLLVGRLVAATCDLAPPGTIVECTERSNECYCAHANLPDEQLMLRDLRVNQIEQVCGTQALAHAEKIATWEHVWVYVDVEKQLVLGTCDIECRQNDACGDCVPVSQGWACGEPPVGEQTTVFRSQF